MPDVQLDGTNTTLSFPDSMSQDAIGKVLATHPLVQQLHGQAQHDALMAPRDPGFESQVQQFTQKFLQPGDKSAPSLQAQQLAGVPAYQRVAFGAPGHRLADYSNDIGRAAVLRRAYALSDPLYNAPPANAGARVAAMAASQGVPVQQGTTPAGKPGVVPAPTAQGQSVAAYQAQQNTQRQAQVDAEQAKQAALARQQWVAQEHARAASYGNVPGTTDQRRAAAQTAQQAAQAAQAASQASQAKVAALGGDQTSAGRMAYGAAGRVINKVLGGGGVGQDTGSLAEQLTQHPGSGLDALVPGTDAVLQSGTNDTGSVTGKIVNNSFYKGVAPVAAAGLQPESVATMLAAGPLGELAGVPKLLHAYFVGQAALGTAHAAADTDTFHKDNGQYFGALVANAAQLGAPLLLKAATDEATARQFAKSFNDQGGQLFVPDMKQATLAYRGLKRGGAGALIQKLDNGQGYRLYAAKPSAPAAAPVADAASGAAGGAANSVSTSPDSTSPTSPSVPAIAKVHAADSAEAQAAKPFVPVRVSRTPAQAETQAADPASGAVTQPQAGPDVLPGGTAQSPPVDSTAKPADPALEQHLSEKEAAARARIAQREQARQKQAEQAQSSQSAKPAENNNSAPGGAQSGDSTPASTALFQKTAENENSGGAISQNENSGGFGKGRAGTAYTSDNTPVPFRYELREGRDLIASHSDTMQPNPRFDQSLQPRDRSRVASEAQVSDLATRLNPARLGASASTSDGSPIVGPDNQVESGNGRTLGILRAYDRGLPGAEAYRQYLKQSAGETGIDAAHVDQMQHPVLVRVRTNDIAPGARGAFADEMGKTGVSGMSDVETAQGDAQKMRTSGLLGQFVGDDGGNVGSRENLPFVRGFLEQLPVGERNALIQPDGSLSAAGVRRIRAGVLASAYDDGNTLQRMLESTDDNARNVGTAMLNAAPKFAALKDAIAQGSRHDLDITGDVTSAANTLSHLRDRGVSVETHLAQQGMFDEDLSPVGKELLRTMENYKRSGKKLQSVFDHYAEVADAAGDPRQQSLFGDTPPSPLEALHAALRLTEESHAQPNTQQTLGLGGEPAQRGTAGEPGQAETRPGANAGAGDGGQPTGGSGGGTRTGDAQEWLKGQQDAATQRLQKRSRGLNSGVDPEDLRDLAIVGSTWLARQGLGAAEFGARMIGEFGEAVRPHLEQIYQAARDHYHAEIAPRFGLSRLDEGDTNVTNGPDGVRSAAEQGRSANTDTGAGVGAGGVLADGRGHADAADADAPAPNITGRPEPGQGTGIGQGRSNRAGDGAGLDTAAGDKKAGTDSGSNDGNGGATGTRNEVTEAERAARGADPVERQLYTDMGAAYGDGKAAVEGGVIDPAGIAREVAEKPRPLNAQEVGALAYDRYRLQKQYNGQSAALDKAIADGAASEIASWRETLKQTDNALDLNEQALVKGGREQSAAFAARKIVVSDDGSLADVVQRAKRSKGAELTDAEKTRYQSLVDKYNEAQKQVEAQTAQIEQMRKAAGKKGTGKSAVGDKPAGAGDVREAVNPRTREYGKTNKLFTADKAEQARQNIAQKLSRVSADPTGIGALTDVLPDLVELGGYHLEAGLREFGAWAKQMRADVSEKLSDADLQHIWTNVRSEAMNRAETAPHPASDVFVDRLAKRLGREGATAFVNSLADEQTGNPEILNKLLSGSELSPDEQARVNQAYLDNMPQRGAPQPATGPLKTVTDLVAEQRQASAEQAKAGRSAEQLLTESLTRRLGKEGAQAFLAQVAPGGDRTLLDAVLGGKELSGEQARRVAQAYLDNTPRRAGAVEPTGALKTISDVADQARQDQGRAARAAAKANQPEPTVAQQLERRLVQQLGREGANQFLDKLNPATRNGLLNGTLTDAQKAVVSDLYESLRRPAAKPGELDRASAALQGAVGESRQAAAEAAKANKPPLTEEQQFTRRVTQHLGKEGADAFFKSVDPDALKAMLAGQELSPEQQKAVADVYTAAQKPKATPAQQTGAAKQLGQALAETRSQARLQGQIGDLQTELQTGQAAQNSKAGGGGSGQADSPQVAALKAQRAELQRQAADPRRVRAISAQIADLEGQLKSGDTSKTQAEMARNQAKREQALASQSADLQAAIRQRDFMKARIRAQIDAQAPKTKLSRFVEATRAFKLSGTAVFAKLGGASLWAVPVEGLADLMGAGAGRLTVKGQRLGDVAAREGQFSASAELAGARAMFSRRALANAKSTILTGMNEIDAQAGKEQHGTGFSILDTPGRLHGAMKAFLQTGQYTKSLQMRLARASAQGLDVSDPEVQARIGMGAAIDAQNSILKGDNKAAELINNLVGVAERSPDKKAQVAGAILRTLLPVVKVPANYMGKAIDMTGVGLVRGAAMQIKAARSGEALTPEVADNILRAYKYGGMGLLAAYLGLAQPAGFQTGGYYAQGAQPGRDKDGKPMEFGGIEVGGQSVPHLLAHSPFAESVQFWATMRRGFAQAKETDTLGKTGEALRQSVGGLGREAPGLESTMEAGKILGGERDAGKALGTYAKNQVVPQIVQQGARALDRGPDGKPVPRQTRGFREGFAEGVPGLRSRLPVKASKGAGGAGLSDRSGMADVDRMLNQMMK